MNCKFILLIVGPSSSTVEADKLVHNNNVYRVSAWPLGYRTFFICSTILSMKFILLINIKMPTVVGILIFISRIYTISESSKTINNLIFQLRSSNRVLSSVEHERSFITSGLG